MPLERCSDTPRRPGAAELRPPRRGRSRTAWWPAAPRTVLRPSVADGEVGTAGGAVELRQTATGRRTRRPRSTRFAGGQHRHRLDGHRPPSCSRVPTPGLVGLVGDGEVGLAVAVEVPPPPRASGPEPTSKVCWAAKEAAVAPAGVVFNSTVTALALSQLVTARSGRPSPLKRPPPPRLLGGRCRRRRSAGRREQRRCVEPAAVVFEQHLTPSCVRRSRRRRGRACRRR